MTTEDELPGKFVLVRPDLLNDPAEKKNQVGAIKSADLKNDNVVVSFGEGDDALFSTDALLVMRDIDVIRGYAEYDYDQLLREDYFDIMEVCIIAETKDLGGYKAALQLARKSPMAMEYAMRPLDDELGLNRNKTPGR
jgi:hypothetical protein